MGCCGSKDEDDNAKNERSRLLSGEGSTAYDTSHARMNYRYDDAVDHTIEQEALQKIVQQTADNFIDISNTHATERLQQQEAIDRANEYKLDPSTLQKIQEKSDTLPKLRHKKSTSLQSQQVAAQGGATDLPPHVVLGSGGVTREDQEWLTKAIDEMHEAIEHIEVEYVGDLVVPLTWANSAPIHAIHG
ncbi:2979_t:CDS:2 [Funneliformis mosseae]|uniref:Ragulator complex protein LAMTOR1 n=1 Tax=Funneliformis mosseae TaxID=27381 RepID=A0A9N9A7U6_FUNMO|nr:2979_t:CDS:2 [Funneliformis mosseae]